MYRFLIGLLVVVLLVGYFRGWFHMESHDSSGQSGVSVTVDKDKFNQDKASAKEEVKDLGQK
jgi:hypothetical protein